MFVIPSEATSYTLKHLSCSGVEVASCIVDQEIWVRFPAYHYGVQAVWWQGGSRHLRTFRCTCQDKLGMYKTPSCPLPGCQEAGLSFETGQLSRHYIAEILLNLILNYSNNCSAKTCIKGCVEQDTYIWACPSKKRAYGNFCELHFSIQLL